MKTLIITRHAKAKIGVSDILRELEEPRSSKDLKSISSDLQKCNAIPSIIICSPAIRTVETSNILSKYFNKVPVKVLKSLYLGVSNEIFENIDYIGQDEDIIMIVGHNPSMEILIKDLSGIVTILPTSGTAVIDFETNDWKEVRKGKLRKLFIPI